MQQGHILCISEVLFCSRISCIMVSQTRMFLPNKMMASFFQFPDVQHIILLSNLKMCFRKNIWQFPSEGSNILSFRMVKYPPIPFQEICVFFTFPSLRTSYIWTMQNETMQRFCARKPSIIVSMQASILGKGIRTIITSSVATTYAFHQTRLTN